MTKALPSELRREGEIWKLDGERSTEGNREKYKEIQRDTGRHRETAGHTHWEGKSCTEVISTHSQRSTCGS